MNAVFLLRTEIQDTDRGPATSEAHGLSWRRRAGRDYEGQGHVLDDASRIPGTRASRRHEETWSQLQLKSSITAACKTSIV